MGIDRELYFFYGVELSESKVDDYINLKYSHLNDVDRYINLSENVNGFFILNTMSGTKYFLAPFQPEPREEDKVYKLDALTVEQTDFIKSLMKEFNVADEIKPICIINNY